MCLYPSLCVCAPDGVTDRLSIRVVNKCWIMNWTGLDWTGLDWTELHAHTTCPSPQLHPVSCLGSNSPMLCPSPSWFRSRFFFKVL